MFSLCKLIRLDVIGAVTAGVITCAFAANYSIGVDGGIKQGDVPHFWSRCVGTGGAHLCLREDWRNAARIGVQEVGFEAFRGHGILSASNPVHWDEAGNPIYDWTTFDRIYDFLVDTLGTIPVVELSFTPLGLQSNKGERNPPKDLNEWRDFIYELVSHCIDRYGRERVRKWLWEVWNEPNYIAFWGGTEEEYFQLYKYTVDGAKSADSQVIIGGPSTTTLTNGEVTRFLDFCKSNNVPVDMVTNHSYNDMGQISGPGPTADPIIIRDDNRKRVDLINNFGKKLLSVNSEYNTSYAGPGGKTGANCYSMDSHVNGGFVAKCVKLLLDDHSAGTYPAPDVLSYWTISDVFDEGSYIENHNEIPFAQVFGLVSYHGIRKATFNAFKLLHMTGTTRLSLTGGTGEADGVDGFATVNHDSSEVAVLVYNFYKELGGQTASDNVDITVNNLPLPNGKVEVTHFRIDSMHSNAYGVWLKQGKPSKPSTAQWNELSAASELAVFKKDTIDYSGAAYSESFTLPRQGISFLMFRKAGTTAIGMYDTKPVPPELNVSGAIVTTGGRRLDLSFFSMDGKLITTCSMKNGSIDLRNVTGYRGVSIVRIVYEGNVLTSKIVRILRNN